MTVYKIKSISFIKLFGGIGILIILSSFIILALNLLGLNKYLAIGIAILGTLKLFYMLDDLASKTLEIQLTEDTILIKESDADVVLFTSNLENIRRFGIKIINRNYPTFKIYHKAEKKPFKFRLTNKYDDVFEAFFWEISELLEPYGIDGEFA